MRILSLQPSITLTLERLGKLDLLVGCTKYCVDAVPQLAHRKLPVVQDSWSAETEELLPIRPDLVIASVPYRQQSLEAILKANVPVLLLSPRTLTDIYQDIRLIGSVAGATSAAEAIVTEMRAEIANISARTSNLRGCPLVYCEEWGKPLIHSQTWVQELIEAAGGEPLGAPGTITTAEAVAEEDPDVILTAWCGAGDRVPLERIVEQRGWHYLRAVRQQKVFCIRDEWLNTPAHTLVRGLHAIAAALHPDVFDSSQLGGDLRRINLV